ncbi:DNA-processing protein DprA [Xanthomonas campestris]|uniref:DNA-processing protein DprA n=1 Tax=Xanthomonas campestris TaxID=339 RepID=UPI00096DBC04|nr:DNA-processing protein DprA [Xanthomonas campestris]MCF8828051.1 DNA-processing protein DprA [Xanthomonas campestris pv. raphani]MEA9839573.1 DNA-processing protein DprA [Xanthomonas campestris pv. raphani]MEA9875619.1 DNA-processing protein DprA [Xanthomonas campestris pv. raphani]MEA9891640.1 DNA-processing protein DprA [Xanthomonas campestris pv. raphani]MEA9931895.1 DNA-processing protein DprA [Xanthomonas campestris pv. raphani]
MDLTEPDRRALLTLLLAGGRSPPRRALLDAFDAPSQILAAGPATWRAAGCDALQIAKLQTHDTPILDAALRWCARPGHHLIGWRDADYPALLRHIANPPLMLFVDGDPAALWHPCVAVVGSRAASAGGRDHTRHFAAGLANAGLGIVSGMAAGVDAIAHEAALARADGITVAVVGTGPDVAYPVQHHSLRDRIAARGAVVSEYLPGTCAVAAHFPARNRIIAGLALGTLVVEAAMRSGALITARLAAEAGREVFALPGSLHNPLARGCHHLIRQGATLVQEPAQLVEGLRLLSGELADALRQRLTAPTEQARTVLQPTPRRSDPDYQRLWHALGHDPTPMDSLLESTGLTAAALSSMLLIMELEGDVVTEHGRYTRNP